MVEITKKPPMAMTAALRGGGETRSAEARRDDEGEGKRDEHEDPVETFEHL